MSDVFAQAESIARRKKLFEALQSQSMGAPIVGKTGVGQVLAKLGTTWLTNSGQKDLERESTTQRGQYGQELAGELEKFMSRREGAPGDVLNDSQAMDLMQNNVNPTLREPVPADPKGAVFSAIASRFPEMQAVGQAGLKDVLSQQKGGNKGPYKDHTVDGKIIRVYDTGEKQVIGDFKDDDQWGEPYLAPGPNGTQVLLRKNTKTGKVESVAGSGQQFNVNFGDKKGIEGLVEASLPGGKSYEPAKSAAQSLAIANEQLAAIQQGAVTGSFGQAQQELRKFGELLGIPNAATAPTEMLGNLAKQRVLAKLGGLGAQISNSDRDFLSSAQGDLSTNPEAMKRLLAISMAADIRELNRHQEGIKGLDGLVNPALMNSMNIRFTAQISDPQVGEMVGRILSGQPSVAGVPGASSANPQGGPPTAGKPVVRNW